MFYFTGAKDSDVPGNLVFSMLIIGFPSSIIAYPVASIALDLFKDFDLFVYNSRIVLAITWVTFFVFGAAQWSLIVELVKRYKSTRSLND